MRTKIAQYSQNQTEIPFKVTHIPTTISACLIRHQPYLENIPCKNIRKMCILHVK